MICLCSVCLSCALPRRAHAGGANTLVYGTLVYNPAQYTLALNLTEQQLGQAIRRRREVAGFSQEGFAERAQVHRTYVSQLERGLKSPSVRVLMKMADALGCEAWELLREASGNQSSRR